MDRFVQELHDLIPPYPFYHKPTRHGEGRYQYVVDISPIRTKRFSASFIMRAAREWNSLPASVFPSSYNMGVFKKRVNRYLISKCDPS